MAGTTIDRPATRARLDVDASLITPLVYGVAVAALGLIRVAIGGGIDRMWAEDGSVFYEVANGGSLTDGVRLVAISPDGFAEQVEVHC